MPEIFRVFGFRFYFFSLEHLPIHVHVQNSDGECKFEIKPVSLKSNDGMKEKDARAAERIVRERALEIEQKWKGYFGE